MYFNHMQIRTAFEFSVIRPLSGISFKHILGYYEKKYILKCLADFVVLFLTPVILFPSFSLVSKEAEAERPSKPGGYLQAI